MTIVSVQVSERIATITLDRPEALNSLTNEGLNFHTTVKLDSHHNTTLDYDAFANALREIDAKEEVLVTVWQGLFSTLELSSSNLPLTCTMMVATGDWFCSYVPLVNYKGIIPLIIPKGYKC